MTMLVDSSKKPDVGEHGLICWATAVLILADATDAKFADTIILCASDILSKSLTTRDRNEVVTSLSRNRSIKLKNIKLHLPNSSFYRITAKRRAPQSKKYSKRMAEALKMLAQGYSYNETSKATHIPAGTLRSRQSRLSKK